MTASFNFGLEVTTIRPGITLIRGLLQGDQFDTARSIAQKAPFFCPTMTDGTKFRQKLTNCGDLGWIADQHGYRYVPTHPVTGEPWPPIPTEWQDICDRSLSLIDHAPVRMESGLLNFYPWPSGRLGMHQDRTEKDLTSPIVTISQGYSCQFKVADRRDGAGDTVTLHHNDIVIMHGVGRMAWHGVMKLLPTDCKTTGRLSITFRKVN